MYSGGDCGAAARGAGCASRRCCGLLVRCSGGDRRTGVVDLVLFVLLRMPSEERTQVRSPLFQLVPADVVTLIDGPAGENPTDLAVLLRIVQHRDTGLTQLSEYGRSIESRLAGIRSGDDHP